jgi:hypothetical protein
MMFEYMGIPVFESPHLVDVQCVGPKKKHRKRRIQKKWTRRYGYEYRRIPQAMLINDRMLGRKLVAHPEVVAILRELQSSGEKEQGIGLVGIGNGMKVTEFKCT